MSVRGRGDARTLDLVAGALKEAARLVWFDLDEAADNADGAGHSGIHGSLALGLELAHEQARVVLERCDDRHQPQPGITATESVVESLVESADPGVAGQLVVATELLDLICEAGLWELPTARLRVAVAGLRREAGRAGY